MTAYMPIRFERRAEIGTLTLARPAKRNAQNPLMWQELQDLGRRLSSEETLRCLVVTGEGPSFSAGIDLVEGMAGLLAELADGTPAHQAMAGGLQLALACDFRIFSENARVGLIETRYGLLPDMGATVRLPRIIGEGRARELILLGDVIDAAEALRIGLAK